MKRTRQAAGCAILILSLGLLVWSAWPPARTTQVIKITGEQFQKKRAGSSGSFEPLQLQVNWPSWIQAGRLAEIELIIEAQGILSAAAQPSEGSYPITQMIEARLELPGVQTAPNGVINRALTRDAPMDYHWQVRPLAKGHYPGSLWLHLTSINENAQGAPQHDLLSVQRLEIRADDLFGLTAYLTQILAVMGIILGLGLCSDVVYDWYVLKTDKRSEQK